MGVSRKEQRGKTTAGKCKKEDKELLITEKTK
jgi:hypothetical protein